jgi:membrane associated rhomboid family serine protease
MFFPIGTDEPIRRQAWCTYGIILITALCFFFLHAHVRIVPESLQNLDPEGLSLREFSYYQWQAPTWMPLKNPGFVWYQLITYQFAHAGIMHLVMNMVFLFAFGRALENKLGHVAFLALYLAGGGVAGLAHILTSSAPVIGASGSVCAVTGMFLALLPNANVRVVYFFYVSMGVLEVTGLTLILTYFCLDLIMTVLSIRSAHGAFSVAYTAHLGGYLFGILLGLGLLKFKFIPTSHNDLLHMISQYRRRQEFRRLNQSGNRPWLSTPPSAPLPPGVSASTPLTPEKEQILQLRADIHSKAQAQDFDAACDLYSKLIAIDPAQTLTRQTQHDLANHFFSTSKHAQAANAYERFLETYKADPDKSQIQLMLTILYLRYLNQPAKARTILDEATPLLTETDHKLLAATLREEMGAQ